MRAVAAFRNPGVLLAAVLVWLFPVASARAGSVITPVGAHVSMAYAWTPPPLYDVASNLISDVGLTTDGHVTTWTQNNAVGDYGMWLNDPYYAEYIQGNEGRDWLLFHLGSRRNIGRAYIWQYNSSTGGTGRDLKEFNINGSSAVDDGDQSTGPLATYHDIGGGTLTLQQTAQSHTGTETCQVFELVDANGVASVYIDIRGNYGDYYTGLSKVRFEEKYNGSLLIIR